MVSMISLFPRSAEIGKNGNLFIGGCDITKLVAENGTPLYVFCEETLRRNCRSFKEEFGRIYQDVTVTYAGKAWLNKTILNIIKEEGLGLDVVSGGEMTIAENAGFPMDAACLHGNNKSAEEIRMALRNHVGHIVVDNYDELNLLSQITEETGHIPEIMLRIAPGVNPHTHDYIATGKMDTKFGFPLYEAADAVAQAMAKPNLSLVGFHFHIGSLITETQPYQEAIELVLDFAADMNERYGFKLEELDVGGGFAIPYTTESEVPPLANYAQAVVTTIVNKCKELNLPLPALTIEPGRAIIGQAGVAVYKVGAIKDITGIRRYIIVDGGLADNIRPALYGAKYEAVVANKMLEKEQELVTIAGPYCESGDVLVKDIDMPTIELGDIIAVPDCGAYCLPMANNYNGALKPAVMMTRSGEARLIRRRESYEDLVRHDI